MSQQFQVAVETVERFGHPTRHFPVAVSAEVMAMSWASTEDAPAGATVFVDHEIGPRGFLGRLWKVPPGRSLNLSIVLRPPLPPEEGDVAWLVAGLAGAMGAEEAGGAPVRTWWPDRLVDGDGTEVASLHATIQLGPGRIKYAVITVRIDAQTLGLAGEEGRDRLLEGIVRATDSVVADLEHTGAAAVAEAYSQRCALVGQRLKLALRPKGETRGLVRRVDPSAHLELESAGGLAERIGVDQLRQLNII